MIYFFICLLIFYAGWTLGHFIGYHNGYDVGRLKSFEISRIQDQKKGVSNER